MYKLRIQTQPLEANMKAGLFLMPSHPPERSPFDAQQWDLEVLSMVDEAGYSEAWIGEHFTALWEPNPAPDLLIAQALMRTKNIKLATGAHLLPFHNPVELAHRVAFLDHLAQGRYMFGVGAGGLPTDHEMFGIDMAAGQHREMTRESLDIILSLWEHMDGPFQYEGKYWNFNIPDPKENEYATLRTFMGPLQKPHPPIGIAAASIGSDTLKIAGERGYIPMSLGLNAVYLASHWDSIVEGARSANRQPPPRSDWRIVRDVWVADTDEEAREGALGGMLGRAWRDYLHPLFSYGAYPFISSMKHDESIPDEDVTVEYMADNLWLIGSPDTVARKIRDLYEMVGGFGTLLWLTFDHSENRAAYEKSVNLMAHEVMPQLADLTGD
jgi:alkanesulfonate monooxygenase SsuD/methylene tetrahydromethanopterin reductase-like flavin-dependent oxidoreductase (luciferase family)